MQIVKYSPALLITAFNPQQSTDPTLILSLFFEDYTGDCKNCKTVFNIFCEKSPAGSEDRKALGELLEEQFKKIGGDDLARTLNKPNKNKQTPAMQIVEHIPALLITTLNLVQNKNPKQDLSCLFEYHNHFGHTKTVFDIYCEKAGLKDKKALEQVLEVWIKVTDGTALARVLNNDFGHTKSPAMKLAIHMPALLVIAVEQGMSNTEMKTVLGPQYNARGYGGPFAFWYVARDYPNELTNLYQAVAEKVPGLALNLLFGFQNGDRKTAFDVYCEKAPAGLDARQAWVQVLQEQFKKIDVDTFARRLAIPKFKRPMAIQLAKHTPSLLITPLIRVQNKTPMMVLNFLFILQDNENRTVFDLFWDKAKNNPDIRKKLFYCIAKTLNSIKAVKLKGISVCIVMGNNKNIRSIEASGFITYLITHIAGCRVLLEQYKTENTPFYNIVNWDEKSQQFLKPGETRISKQIMRKLSGGNESYFSFASIFSSKSQKKSVGRNDMELTDTISTSNNPIL